MTSTDISVQRVAAHVPKCPRCRRYQQTSTLNFDGLCDRCCVVIIAEFPGHEAVSDIKAAYARQKAMTPRDWRVHNHALDPVAWPLREGDADV